MHFSSRSKATTHLRSNSKQRVPRAGCSQYQSFRRVRIVSDDHDRGHRARPARARFPETLRWAGGGRTPPRAPTSRRRSAEMETRATAWCVPPGAGRLKFFADPTHATRFWHTPRDRGCRRVRRDASRIATPSARTRARDSLTARMRAGAEGFPRDWRASGAPERARGTRRRFLVLRLDVRRAPSDSTSRVSSV